ncbi:hypothetical protein ACH5RR_023439 [Cinchona calisaya]|uniref:Uncharacterized protein n=1 Tax=Cinchona calisaya TaxID=153742 RepID=A0ABD2ZAP5_9GENT
MEIKDHLLAVIPFKADGTKEEEKGHNANPPPAIIITLAIPTIGSRNFVRGTSGNHSNVIAWDSQVIPRAISGDTSIQKTHLASAHVQEKTIAAATASSAGIHQKFSNVAALHQAAIVSSQENDVTTSEQNVAVQARGGSIVTTRKILGLPARVGSITAANSLEPHKFVASQHHVVAT